MIFLTNQRESDGQKYKTITKMEDQNFILIKKEELVLTRSYTCDKEEESEDCIEILGEISSEVENLWARVKSFGEKVRKPKVSV